MKQLYPAVIYLMVITAALLRQVIKQYVNVKQLYLKPAPRDGDDSWLCMESKKCVWASETWGQQEACG